MLIFIILILLFYKLNFLKLYLRFLINLKYLFIFYIIILLFIITLLTFLKYIIFILKKEFN